MRPAVASRRFLRPCLIALLLIDILPAQSQTTQSNASSILGQVTNAFSAGKPVTNVQLTGSANWYAGSFEDSGTVTLTASSTGAASMQLSLAKKGSWTESQSAFGMGVTCQWAGNNGAAHQGDSMNCLRPITWFLPQLSLQPASLPANIGVADLGTGAVGTGTYRHLQSQAVLAQMPASLLSRSVEASTTDIGLDPGTWLPSVLRYQVHPDDGAQVNIPIEIRYSDYRKVNGAEIPFLIQRYINGSLQLEIHITSAQIS
jgi:hypothetical protein